MDQTPAVEAKFKALSPRLDEATLRLWAAAEARSLGRGGVSVVAKVAGLSRTTIYAGLADIEAASKAMRKRGKAAAQALVTATERKRIRAPGGGRKRLVDIDASLLADLDALVEPTSRGDPIVSFALDVQEYDPAGRRACCKGPSGEPAHGVRPAGSTALQPSVGAQDA